MTKLLVAIQPELLDKESRDKILKHSSDYEPVFEHKRELIIEQLAEVEISIGEVPRDLLAKAPKLKWHQQLGTGTEWLSDYPEAVRHPFILTNSSDDYGVVLAEHVMALILVFARQLTKHFDDQRKGVWVPDNPKLNDPDRFELRGKTLLLVGVGSIGKEIAKRAHAFGLRIVGLRSNPDKKEDHVEKMYAVDDLHIALAEADLVVNSLPITQSTIKLFDQRAFSEMKNSAYFFNIGRGATVDEKAMIKALRENQIAGAGLDVFETEPLPEESPLWKLPNVIITPHGGGNHINRYSSWIDTALDNLERYVNDRPLRNLVDKQRGY